MNHWDEGIHDMPEAEYHGTPTEAPCLSTSIAKVLLTHSPRHAWTKHPGLNPGHQRKEDERKFDLGTATHEYVLKGEQTFRVVHHDSWRSNAAKQARENAEAVGSFAILEKDFETVQAMAQELNKQLDRFEGDRPFSAGKPEQTLIWNENGVWFKARLDWLANSYQFIDDYKTTGASAEPSSWIRRMLFTMNFDVQAELYRRGLKFLTGEDAEFRFIVQENVEPYGVSVVGLDPAAEVIAQKKVNLAIDIWAECMRTGEWPMYPTRTCYAAPPAWAEAQILEQEDACEAPQQIFTGRAG